MDRFEHVRIIVLLVDVARGRETEAAGDDGGDVGRDVAEEVRGDDDVELVRAANQVHRGAVDEQAVDLDFGELSRDFLDDVVPEDHRVGLCVRFGDRGEVALAFGRRLEGAADDAFGALPGEQTRLDGDFVVEAVVFATADVRVLALGVLAVDDEVDVAALVAPERALDALEQLVRALADVLVEPLPNREEETVERHVVGNFGVADRTEEDRIGRLDSVESVVGHHCALLQIALGAPVVGRPLQREAVLFRDGIEHVHRGARDFGTDTVARDDGHVVRLHAPPYRARL